MSINPVGQFGGNKAIPKKGELHARLLSRLVSRITSGESATSQLRARWKTDEEQFIGYTNATAEDLSRKANRDAGKPEYTTLHIPYNYALLLTAHTYITSVVFSRTPVWQVRGRNGQGAKNEKAMEALLGYQVLVGNHMPDYYAWTHDALRYGFGVLGHYWSKEMVRTSEYVKEEELFLGVGTGKFKYKSSPIEVESYAGTRTFNVRPANFLWDPRYPISRFQQGEFCGRQFQISPLDMLDPASFFNIEEIRHVSYSNTSGENTNNSALDIPSQNSDLTSRIDDQSALRTAHELFVRIIPRDWGLGSETLPQKWVFLVLNKELIVRAQPLGLYHDKFPFAVTPGEVEVYDRVPRSLLYTTQSLNDTLSWLVNIHLYNVRQSVNNQWIGDPSRIVMSDLTDPNPGKVIRLKPNAYGTDVRTMLSQLPVADVTRGNIADMGQITQILQRMTGVSDMLMGSFQGNRASATEVRSTGAFGTSRMKTLVEYMSAVGFSDHVQMLIQTTQQRMDTDLELRIAGDTVDSPEQLTISPRDIAGFYDLEPVDGTMPIDRLAMVNMWTQLLKGMQGFPQVLQQYDIGKVFGHVAQLGGLRDIASFKLNVLPPGAAPPPGTGPINERFPTDGQSLQIPGIGTT